MKVEIFMATRKKLYNARAIYEDGKITVLAGSSLKPMSENKLKRAKKVLLYRTDNQYVENNIVVKDCTFNSPSTAAQFVTDQSINGFESWKVDRKVSLKEYLSANDENR